MSLEKLKSITKYDEFGTDPLEHTSVKQFWEVLSSFTQEELTRYLYYVWGRTRLSETENTFHYLSHMSDGKSNIPEAHTCGFSIDLWDYPSTEDLKTKLLYGMTHGTLISEDGDEMNFQADFGL